MTTNHKKRATSWDEEEALRKTYAERFGEEFPFFFYDPEGRTAATLMRVALRDGVPFQDQTPPGVVP